MQRERHGPSLDFRVFPARSGREMKGDHGGPSGLVVPRQAEQSREVLLLPGRAEFNPDVLDRPPHYLPTVTPQSRDEAVYPRLPARRLRSHTGSNPTVTINSAAIAPFS